MEKQTLNTTCSSVVSEMLKSEAEEKKAIFHTAIAALQSRFDNSLDVAFVPRPVANLVTQANARLDAALRRVSELEAENVFLQDRLDEEEEDNLKLRQIQRLLEEDLHVLRDVSPEMQPRSSLHEKEVEQMRQRIYMLAQQNQVFRFDHEKTVHQLQSYIKELEEEREASRVKSNTSREVFEEEMQPRISPHEKEVTQMLQKFDAQEKQHSIAAHECTSSNPTVHQLQSYIRELEEELEEELEASSLCEKQVGDMSKVVDALLYKNEELTSKMKRLEVALKQSKQQTGQPDNDGLRWRWQAPRADATDKTLKRLQKRLNWEIQLNNGLKGQIGKMEDELRAFHEEQSYTKPCYQPEEPWDSEMEEIWDIED